MSKAAGVKVREKSAQKSARLYAAGQRHQPVSLRDENDKPPSSFNSDLREILIRSVRPGLVEGHSHENKGFDRFSPNGFDLFSISSGFTSGSTLFLPDQCRHAPARSIAPVGIKMLWIAEGTPLPATDEAHAQSHQTLPCQQCQIAVPFFLPVP